MDCTEIELRLKNKIKNDLPRNRYSHVKRVAKLSGKLAIRYGVDSQKAVIASLAHDLARHWSIEALLDYISSKHFLLSDLERQYPYMLHGLAAGLMLRSEWDFHDQDVFNAVRFHTTGRAGMSKLEKLIYLSDSVEPGRKHVNASIKGQLKEYSLDKMLYHVVKQTIAFQKEKGKQIHPWTMDMYKHLKEIRKNEKQQ